MLDVELLTWVWVWEKDNKASPLKGSIARHSWIFPFFQTYHIYREARRKESRERPPRTSGALYRRVNANPTDIPTVLSSSSSPDAKSAGTSSSSEYVNADVAEGELDPFQVNRFLSVACKQLWCGRGKGYRKRPIIMQLVWKKVSKMGSSYKVGREEMIEKGQFLCSQSKRKGRERRFSVWSRPWAGLFLAPLFVEFILLCSCSLLPWVEGVMGVQSVLHSHAYLAQGGLSNFGMLCTGHAIKPGYDYYRST